MQKSNTVEKPGAIKMKVLIVIQPCGIVFLVQQKLKLLAEVNQLLDCKSEEITETDRLDLIGIKKKLLIELEI